MDGIGIVDLFQLWVKKKQIEQSKRSKLIKILRGVGLFHKNIVISKFIIFDEFILRFRLFQIY